MVRTRMMSVWALALLAASSSLAIFVGVGGCSSSTTPPSSHADSGVPGEGGGVQDSTVASDSKAHPVEGGTEDTAQPAECATNADCVKLGAFPLCDTAMGVCVVCLTATDCPYDAPGCTQGTCGSCFAASDCPANNTCVGAGPADGGAPGICTCHDNTGCGGDAPVCGAGGICGCSADTQCPSGQRCTVGGGASMSGQCIIPCTEDAGACQAITGAPYCMVDSGLCVECVTDPQCASEDAGFNFCVMNTCAQCATNSDCMAMPDAGTPSCVQGLCEQCATYLDCSATAPGCNSELFTCGSCVVDSDCPPDNTCPDTTCVPTDGGVTDAATGG